MNGQDLGAILNFSSSGPSAAPDVTGVKPDITAPGGMIASTLSSRFKPSGQLLMDDGKHFLMSGTSMSAPFVSGTIALIFEANPNFTYEDAKGIIIKSAYVDDDVGSAPNDRWGHGKLSTLKAMELAVGGKPSGNFDVSSNYTYAETSLSQSMDCWITSHIRAFEYFGGVPSILVPDNLKSGITKPCRYEPVINRTYEDMAIHYNTVVIPARVGKPRDKAKVENGVLIAERWILAKLRDRIFYSIEEANEAIWELLFFYNARPMQKIEKSLKEIFDEIEQKALKPLPSCSYIKDEFKNCMVNIDYHIEVGKHYYSVPHIFARELVEARYTSTIVEIFHDAKRIASHRRSYQQYKPTTLPEHMPKSHQRYAEWTPSRIISWGNSKDATVGLLFEKILESRRHPEQGFRTCLGIIRLEKKYDGVRLIAACRKTLNLGAYFSAYKTIKNMLRNRTETMSIPDEVSPILSRHPNVRGGQYYLPNLNEDSILKGDMQ
jgi:transposase